MNFADALGRFTIGALSALPQVSLSYLQPASRSLGGSFLALAIHWFVTNGQRYADGVLPFDNHGRDLAFTSYFCAPYRQLAERAVTYLDMYKAFSAITLPVRDGPPQQVTVTPSAPLTPAVDTLAMRVAPLLLAGGPVCVLGAENTTLDERLRFIDSTMGLLPYGFRAKMTAATWTKATLREHRFRLFFSNAPRSDGSDQLVHWGEPGRVSMPSGHASEYYEWLSDKVDPLAQLSELRIENQFGASSATQALELIDGIGRRRRRHPARPWPTGLSGTTRSGGAVSENDPVETALEACADLVQSGNVLRLRSAIRELRHLAESGDGDALNGHRQRYQDLLSRHKLLGPHPELKKLESELCAAVLAVAFTWPLTYQDYCKAEKLVAVPADERLPAVLLEAMEQGGLGDPIVTAIVLSHLDSGKLNKWLRTGQIDVVRWIGLLAREWDQPVHARVVCDVTLAYLRMEPARFSNSELRQVLLQHGFLAHALYLRHPDEEQYQVFALHRFLLSAYPGGLDRAAVLQVLTGGSGHPPTPALFASVLKLLALPDDWELACTAYIHGAATLVNLDAATSAQLLERIPDISRLGKPDGNKAASGRGADDPTEVLLLACARQLRAQNLADLKESVIAVRAYAAHATDRDRYRAIVTEQQMLRPDLRLRELADEYYDMLVKVAFGTPLGYRGYCQIMESLTLAGQPEERPHDLLLMAIDRAASVGRKDGSPDLRLAGIVAAYLGTTQRDTRFRSGQLDPGKLIAVLAEEWDRPHHAKLVLGMTTGYLSTAGGRHGGYNRTALLSALREHAHLAPALQDRYPRSGPDQIAALTELLDAVYPNKLDGASVRAILTPKARTFALLTVLIGKTDDPEVKAWILGQIFETAHKQP